MSEDFELDKTIGDVFKEITEKLNNEEHHNDESHQSSPSEHNLAKDSPEGNDEGNDDVNLDEAISNVFNSLQDELTENQGRAGQENADGGADQGHMEKEVEDQKESQEENDDDLLADAISNALQSINEIRPQERDLEGRDTQERVSREKEQAEEQGQEQGDEQDEEQDGPEEQQEQDQQNHKTDKQVESKENHYSPLIMEKDDDLDLENAIGDAFASIKNQPSKPKDNIPDDIPDDEGLSKVISESFQNLKHRLDPKQSINDDILNELAKEITHQVQQMDNEPKKNLALPKIDETVLDHFINQAKDKRKTEKHTDTDDKEKDDDLNQLQMNDILTNAFNMAMENPSELLNNLESEEFNLTNDLIPKKLSIADTLALHRSRDSQLQSILSNLTNQNVGGNLVNIIKQITSFITNSNFQVFKNTTSLITVINNYKNTQFESTFLSSLNLAKAYLRSDNNTKSIIAIDNVLLLFGKSNDQVINYDFSQISILVKALITIISNFRTLKNFRAERPKINSLEYKEKIRLENRERKKKWREDNSERNKDNDLRSRVLKRANVMFGNGSSIEKTNWMEEEFQKRKEKRLARQQKEEEGQFKTGEFKNMNVNNNSTFINDKNLIKLIEDFFNIFSNFAPRDDNQTGLYTTCTTIACVGIGYLTKFNVNFEFKRVESIITSVVTNLINSMNTLDQQERILYLARGSSTFTSVPTNDPISSLTTRSYGMPSIRDSNSDNIFSRIQSTIKDYDDPNKRMKLTNDFRDHLNQMNLKFPNYKNDKKVELKRPTFSKPSFQRPSYSTGKKDYGFPQFLSLKSEKEAP